MLTVDRSNMKDLRSRDLKQFDKLRFLYVWNNDLATLHNDLFVHSAALEVVSFDFNQITSIGFDLLKPLTALQEISMLENPCIDEKAKSVFEIENFARNMKSKCSPPYVKFFMEKLMSFQQQLEKNVQEQATEKLEITAVKNVVQNLSLEKKLKELSKETAEMKTNLTSQINALRSSLDKLIGNFTRNSYSTAI